MKKAAPKKAPAAKPREATREHRRTPSHSDPSARLADLQGYLADLRAKEPELTVDVACRLWQSGYTLGDALVRIRER